LKRKNCGIDKLVIGYLLLGKRQRGGIIMKQSFVLFLTILTGVSSVCANLGDSDDRIDDVYGKLVERHLLDDGTVSMVYHKDRYLYFVIFDQRRSVLERYSRTDRADLSPKEISKFLKANAAGGTWTRHDTSKGGRFERSDHKAEATYLNMDGRPTLTVRALTGQKRAPGPGED
jgi:hypothetical protein